MWLMIQTEKLPRNRYDLAELAGAFGDLGTLIPFVVAYITILQMNPNSILVGFGVALIAVGLFYRTPFPVQPMKAIGASAVSQFSIASGLTSSIVVSASLMTGVIWFLLAITGVANKVSKYIPKSALLGVVMGLGFSFMAEGLRMMATDMYVAGFLLMLTLALLNRPKVPAMFVLLAIGIALAIYDKPQLMSELSAIKPEFVLPSLAIPTLTANDLWLGLIMLALPQLPLTFGNAYVSITEENNKLFPNRKVKEKTVALSTAIMNLFAGAVGSVPMCHGAGGMAGHIQFGARTGGATVMLGALLLSAGVFFPSSITTIFKLFPTSVLGVILFLAGVQLALGSRDNSTEKADRFIVLATAGIAVFNVGLAVLFGIASHQLAKRNLFKF